MMMIEHRFFGESQPYLNLSTENLAMLTMEQALKDFEGFIHAKNKELSKLTTSF